MARSDTGLIIGTVPALAGLVYAAAAAVQFLQAEIYIGVADWNFSPEFAMLVSLSALVVVFASSDTRDWAYYDNAEKSIIAVAIILMGFDMGGTIIDLGSGHIITTANTAAMATFAYVAYSNDWSRRELSAIQAWVLVATFGLILAPPFFPLLVDTLAESGAAMAALLIQIGGFVTFSYLG